MLARSEILRSPSKDPFDIDQAVRILRKATRVFPKAMLFELADRGYRSVFEQLIACLISIRTLDEVSLQCSLELFHLGRTAHELASISVQKIDRVISKSTFHLQKAYRIHEIARIAVDQYGGHLPCSREILISLPGVGPKCANLALGISCGLAGVGVDVHVHRITRRWGYIRSETPEKAVVELEAKLPKRYWIEINSLLVPFGKQVCRGTLPKCSICPLLRMCRQIGVKRHA